jgi:hypothetical protein
VDAIRKMMAKDPADRFPDIDSAIHAFGAPASKKEGEVVRTQMISLAKSGPQKRLSKMNVPISPIPIGKAAPRPEPTVIEPAKKTQRPRPENTGDKKSGAGKWIGIAAVLVGLAAGGGYYVKVVDPSILGGTKELIVAPQGGTDSAQASAQRPDTATQQVVAAFDSTAYKDSIRRIALAEAKAEALKAFNDSVSRERRAEQRVAQRRADSIARETKRAADAAAKQGGGGGLSKVAGNEANVVAAEPPKPGSIKIASNTPNAILYLNGTLKGPLGSVQTIEVPSGQLKISITAAGCETMDLVVAVAPGATTTVGNKRLKCN